MGRRRKSAGQPLLFDGADEPVGVGTYGQRVEPASVKEEQPQDWSKVRGEPLADAEYPGELPELFSCSGQAIDDRDHSKALIDLALTAMARAAAFIRGGQYATATTVLEMAKEDIEQARGVTVFEADIVAAGAWPIDAVDEEQEWPHTVTISFASHEIYRGWVSGRGLLNAMWSHEREGE